MLYYELLAGGDVPLAPGSVLFDPGETITMSGVYSGTATIVGEEITAININSPGSGYKEDFYIYFYGGGGTGALALATVSPQHFGPRPPGNTPHYHPAHAGPRILHSFRRNPHPTGREPRRLPGESSSTSWALFLPDHESILYCSDFMRLVSLENWDMRCTSPRLRAFMSGKPYWRGDVTWGLNHSGWKHSACYEWKRDISLSDTTPTH